MPQPPDVDKLWERYRATGDASARTALIGAYRSLIEHVARNEPWRRDLDHDDLVGYGVFGLAKAIDTYDPERGMRLFETYARYQIRYAIREEVRTIDWIPKKVHQRGAAVAKVTSILEGKLGRFPTVQEVADELEVPVAAVQRTRDMQDHLKGRALDDRPLAIDPEDSRRSLRGPVPLRKGMLVDHTLPTPESAFDADEMRHRLSAAIASLNEQARVVLALRYREHMDYEQLAAAIGVGRTRACQLHTEAVEALRAVLAGEHVDAFLGGS